MGSVIDQHVRSRKIMTAIKLSRLSLKPWEFDIRSASQSEKHQLGDLEPKCAKKHNQPSRIFVERLYIVHPILYSFLSIYLDRAEQEVATLSGGIFSSHLYLASDFVRQGSGFPGQTDRQ
jgi:hypothetical protein